MSAVTQVPVGQWKAAPRFDVEMSLTSAQDIPAVTVGKNPETLILWLLSHRKM